MLIDAREVTRQDLEAVCSLIVAPGQKDLITPNVMTMAEASFEAGALVRALWRNEQIVGLLAMLRPSAYPINEDIVIRRDAAYIWRLMIGQNFQGQGLGTIALDEAKRTAIEWGYNGMSLTVGAMPHSATPFYKRYGFALTGRRLWDDENELEMVYWFTD